VYTYREDLEILYISEAEYVKKSKLDDVIKTAMRRAEEPLGNLNPWNESTARFVVSPADGIADYIYDNRTKSRFRAPMFSVMPVLIRHGDVVLLPDKLVKKSRVINELEKMLENAKRELERIERRLKRSKSKYLEELKLAWESEIAKITRALEYLTH
jgi:tRNA uridine 5-carbamoylmethylation protein Kti12